jgi:hypothetical protein
MARVLLCPLRRRLLGGLLLQPDTLARNAAAPQPLNVVRATHRREHLDEIEAVLR